MGIEDRDYFRERKFSWVTGELIKPENKSEPAAKTPDTNQGMEMGIQDRDYVRERKLDYRSKYDGRSVPGPYKEGTYPQKITHGVKKQTPPDIPIWVVLLMVIAGFSAAFWALGHWR